MWLQELFVCLLESRTGRGSGCWVIVGLSEREHLIIYQGGEGVSAPGVALRPMANRRIAAP